jgi:hypothetical protein
MPRIASSCPLCGRVQEFSFVRLTKLKDEGIRALIGELKATLVVADARLQRRERAVSKGPRIDADSSARAPGNNQPPYSGTMTSQLGNRDGLALVVGLVSELTVRCNRLAELKALQEVRAEKKMRASSAQGTRRIEFCRSCNKPATLNKAGVCEACLLVSGHRRCSDCGVPELPRSLDYSGKCQKCRGRLRSRSVRAVSGGLPTLGRRR